MLSSLKRSFDDCSDVRVEVRVRDFAHVSLDDPAVFPDEDCGRNAPDAKRSRDAVFPPDREGELVGLRELFDVVITALDKDADESDTLALVSLIRPLKIGSLVLASRSPVRADIHHHRRPATGLIFDGFSFNGLEAELVD
jgi:hypothetical protein